LRRLADWGFGALRDRTCAAEPDLRRLRQRGAALGRPDGTLNLAVVEKQAAHFLQNKVPVAFIGGSTGESHSLSLDERRKLAARWMAVAKGTKLKVIVHVGSNCVADARTLAAHAQKLGAAAVSALAPCYFKPRHVDALLDTCAQIAGGAPGLPFYFYDIPVLTGVSLSMPDFLARGRAKMPNLAGIKWTNSDLYSYQLCRALPGDFDLPWGNDEYLLAALALGARGAVGSTYCFAAPIYRRLWGAFAVGDLEKARAEQYRSCLLVKCLAGQPYGYMGAAKALMGLLGVPVGPARLPNLSPTGGAGAGAARRTGRARVLGLDSVMPPSGSCFRVETGTVRRSPQGEGGCPVSTRAEACRASLALCAGLAWRRRRTARADSLAARGGVAGRRNPRRRLCAARGCGAGPRGRGAELHRPRRRLAAHAGRHRAAR
jgi:N-acetylneuraminate lyase